MSTIATGRSGFTYIRRRQRTSPPTTANANAIAQTSMVTPSPARSASRWFQTRRSQLLIAPRPSCVDLAAPAFRERAQDGSGDEDHSEVDERGAGVQRQRLHLL